MEGGLRVCVRGGWGTEPDGGSVSSSRRMHLAFIVLHYLTFTVLHSYIMDSNDYSTRFELSCDSGMMEHVLFRRTPMRRVERATQ